MYHKADGTTKPYGTSHGAIAHPRPLREGDLVEIEDVNQFLKFTREEFLTWIMKNMLRLGYAWKDEDRSKLFSDYRGANLIRTLLTNRLNVESAKEHPFVMAKFQPVEHGLRTFTRRTGDSDEVWSVP